MNTLIALALLAQIAFVYSYQRYPYPYSSQYEYYVPRPKIIALNPRGFRVSIPHRPGIESFSFHGNLNKPLAKEDGGQYSMDVLDRWGYRWIYEDRSTQLNSGDTIYFWINVRKDGKDYRYENGKYFVTENSFSSEEDDNSSFSDEHWRY